MRLSARVSASSTIAFVLTAMMSWSMGCTSHPLSRPDPRPVIQTDHDYVVDPVKQLDLLFMVDNSSSMKEEQSSLAKNFPLFMSELDKGGVSDLHVAIVSSDFGAGGIDQDGCHGQGDRGQFQVKDGCGLDPNTAHFLTRDSKGTPNFKGKLEDVFACLANLGTSGCGYEHQLQSVRVALSSYNPDLKSFLRPDAYLGIVLLTDEDDCSADPTATLFSQQIDGQDPSFRCNTAGHLCGGQPVPAAPFSAPLASCTPYERAADAADAQQRLINVSDLIAYVKGLKPGRPDRILVAGVIGWTDQAGALYQVGEQPQEGGGQAMGVTPICDVPGAGKAAPGVRLKSFIDAFGANGSWHSICGADLAVAMQKIGAALAKLPSDTCLPAAPLDVDSTQDGVQPDCVVTDTPAAGGPETVIPSCAGGAHPCWELSADSACSSGYRVDVRRADGDMPASGTRESVQCLTSAGADRP